MRVSHFVNRRSALSKKIKNKRSVMIAYGWLYAFRSRSNHVDIKIFFYIKEIELNKFEFYVNQTTVIRVSYKVITTYNPIREFIFSLLMEKF
jgi:hypothetical protein